MDCQAQHTIYDPTDDEFFCPHCGAKAGQFYIEEPDILSEEGCTRLHDNDELRCHSCEHTTTGKEFIEKLMLERNFKVCPCCQGKGFVKGDQ
jgi:DNA-directed RNA polymerase beta' subunit